MEQKIKISLSKTTLDVLKKDCEDFRIIKENGEPNFNAFINTLVVNYYGQSILQHVLKSASVIQTC